MDIGSSIIFGARLVDIDLELVEDSRELVQLLLSLEESFPLMRDLRIVLDQVLTFKFA